MSFVDKYPVPLNELLMVPMLFRARLPALARAPLASAAGMRDLAEFAGHRPGAIRTAMSRLRSSGLVHTEADDQGIMRYTPGRLARSVQGSVAARAARPPGLLLAIFSFSASDAAERQVVREGLRLHGFQKLAQNAYINGRVDTAELEALLRRQGLAEHVFFFPCDDPVDPSLLRRLGALFGLPERARRLRAFQRDLEAFVGARGLSPHDRARRLLYAGPAHFQLTWLDEPALPRQALPAGYPLDAVTAAVPRLAARHAAALRGYFGAVHR